MVMRAGSRVEGAASTAQTRVSGPGVGGGVGVSPLPARGVDVATEHPPKSRRTARMEIIETP
jgi:hypothetical protein